MKGYWERRREQRDKEIDLIKYNNYIKDKPETDDKKIIKLTKLLEKERFIDSKIIKNIDEELNDKTC